jgi:hypothetical protein
VNTVDSNSIRRRTISWVHSSGVPTSRNNSAISFTLRPDRKYVGERCTMVIRSTSGAIAGISVAAVAPDPMTATFLPA